MENTENIDHIWQLRSGLMIKLFLFRNDLLWTGLGGSTSYG